MTQDPPSKKVTLVIQDNHQWLSGLRGISLVVEYLIDKEFGTETGNNETRDIRAAEKIVKAQKIIKLMKEKKKSKNDNPKKE